MTKILGISGSLRGARHGIGSRELVRDLGAIGDKAGLRDYLAEQTRLIGDFFADGRARQVPFDELYRSFRKLPGRRGLSNSEVTVAAALWGASREGAEIDHLSLASHFPDSGTIRDEHGLRDKLAAADGLILSTPVYFGDRGSLMQSLIEFIAADADLRRQLAGKAYGGVAVGAKRNGGQETTLIYQLLDMVNLGFLGVGDSSETAAQYGGTVVGGDIGSAQKDDYGLESAVSTGVRVARVAGLLLLGRRAPALVDKFRIAVWLLQRDRAGSGLRHFEEWAERIESDHPNATVRVFDVNTDEVVRCIACDVCPTSVGPREAYRCIISNRTDFFVRNHTALLEADAILVGAHSPQDRSTLASVYQQFIERTRYLRRDDYAFTDLLTAPLVFSELEARQNLHLRMLTSMVRHHTVVHRPLLGMLHERRVLNAASLQSGSDSFVETGRTLLRGRLMAGGKSLVYNPIGYQISAAKKVEDLDTGLHREAADRVRAGLERQRRERLADATPKETTS